MEILAETRRHSVELCRYIEEVMEAPLRFEGDDPNWHSGQNHIHLWMLEYVASDAGWIDLGYRTRLAEALLSRWSTRLRGMTASLPRGFRLYLYEDLAPTISAVAETDMGFPYPPRPIFLDTPREVMALYVDRDWRRMFGGCSAQVSDKRLLDEITRQSGSIGPRTARALGLQAGHLRILIEQFDLCDEVNAIRKRFHRRPARFRSVFDMPHVYRIYEERVTP